MLYWIESKEGPMSRLVRHIVKGHFAASGQLLAPGQGSCSNVLWQSSARMGYDAAAKEAIHFVMFWNSEQPSNLTESKPNSMVESRQPSKIMSTKVWRAWWPDAVPGWDGAGADIRTERDGAGGRFRGRRGGAGPGSI
jgi:hypothetical protein